MSNKKNEILEKVRKKSRHVNNPQTQNNSKNIISYCRVSNIKQADNYSLEVQESDIKRDAKQNGLKIVKTLRIVGESSKRGSKRPSIKELLEFIETTEHKIHSIVVFHSSRFTRDGIFGAKFIDKLTTKGIGFKDLSDPNDIFTEMGRIRQINNFIGAEQDNITRKKFINAITLEKLQQGYTMRRPPRGYKLFKQNKQKGIKQRVIITDEGKLIQQAFRLKLDYNYSNVMISEIMRPRGLKISDKGLGLIFKNVYYCGFIMDTRLIEHSGYVEGRHPAMITPEEFDYLNYNKEKKRKIRRNEIEQLPLKRYLICSDCNQKLTGYSASNRKNLYYYKCRTKGCNLNTRNEIIHDLYYEFLKKFSFNQSHLPQLKKMLDEVFNMVNKSNKKLQKELKTRITKLEDERKLAIRNYNTDTQKHTVLLELIEFCDTDLDILKEQLNQIRVGAKEIKNNILQALKFINELPSIWSNCDFIFKLKLQELVFPEGIWFDKSSNTLVPPKINPIFGLISVLKGKVNDYPNLDDSENTDKLNQNFSENKVKVRTLKFIENMLVNPCKIWGYNNWNQAKIEEKIPLVVLLSDRSNNFGNKLITSFEDLVEFIGLYNVIK